jgi:hypothetical protein
VDKYHEKKDMGFQSNTSQSAALTSLWLANALKINSSLYEELP